MNDTDKPLILIDGSSWLFRAFHALPPLTAPDGQPTGAVYGMGNMLRKLMKEYAPEYFCVVFDPRGDVFRNELYPEYKANRSETPEDLLSQFPLVTEMLRTMGLPVLAVERYEADDVIGTLTKQACAIGRPVLIVTSDKDMAQLVNDSVHLLDTMKNVRMDPAGVVEKFGVPPERIIDYLTLMGDTVDNIPGVPSVGPKTAAKWITEYGTLDKLVAQADKVGGKVGEKLREALPKLPLSRELATIHCEVPLPVTLDELRPQEPDTGVLAALYRRLGFNRWADELSRPADAPAPQDPAPSVPAAAPETPPPPAANVQPTQVECVLDEAAFDAMIARLRAAPLVCFDTETDSLESNAANLVGLAFSVEAGQGWYLPLAHNYLGAPEQLKLAALRERLRSVLEDPAIPKLAQHAKFDINVLAQHGIVVQGLAQDTMLQSYVLDAAGNRHDMDTLAEKYLGHRTIKFEDVAGKGKNQLTFNQVALDQAAAYSAEDADITLRLHQVLHPKLLADPALLKVYEEIEMPLVPVLASMEQAGVKLDVALLRKISGELAQRMDELQKAAFEQAGGEFNLGSPKQLQTILFEKLQLPVLGKTPKGDPSTAEDVLEELAAQHPLPRLILDWRGMQKLRSTYTDQLPLAVNARTGRVHTSYGQAIAATGRLSSSDPNLQNIPVRTAEGRRIRQAFVHEAGNDLLSIDYSQIELRLMAHFSRDERLQDAFRRGLDIHRATAAEVFGLTLEETGAEQRRAAKAINFGLIYGMSAFGLARQLAIPRGEAQDYIDRFFGRYPGVKRFMDETRVQAHETGYVETLFGRRLYLPNINSRNQGLRQYAERTAINAPLQGTAADLIKKAMITLQRHLRENLPDIRMIMQVHDELVFEGPAAVLKAQAPEIAGLMCRVAALEVPLVADWGTGSNWDAAHEAEGHASS
ncbi:DNA polymerase I [Solimonas sp. K1W22B-7]|uniref:DNA polymerase I n=1 Tax=Solimonas sp. K1W22B-7 TaxID=2303331 RepID=UPI000E32E1C6|nr:DNA polymerase I [Solimonas sp. K1W22B-7]AXQ31421.1 DNA polymerase I [Solimonas sp. K1W22B-7]